LGVKSLKDLVTKRATFINRQDGSGTRVLLDFMLKGNQIDPSEISGYSTIAHTHMEIALAIFQGSAQAGMGIRAAAQLLNLDFVPLANERFDLIIPNECCSTEVVNSLCKSLGTDDFKSNIAHLGGYETYDTGKIMSEQG
jgi:putative molybdopterin biosynthesis protein